MASQHELSPAPDRLESIARLRAALAGTMAITRYEFDDNGAVHLHGRLLVPPDHGYRALRPRMEQAGYTPYLLRHGSEHEVIALPGVIPRSTLNPNLNLVLLLATLASVIFTGSMYSDTGQLDLGAGLLFAASLMGILMTHEMGHYIVGRLRGAPVSLPYFIPLPIISLFGTLGAVIVQREPFEDRPTLLEVGVAGPLAGLLVAAPLFAFGLTLSEVKPIPAGDLLYFGDSMLTRALVVMRYGVIGPETGVDVFLHPVAFGAWIGLFITGINLIPAGQLDGGHIAYALLGERARWLNWAMIGLFLALSLLVSTSWLLWAGLLFLFGRSHPPALNQAVGLEFRHYLLAVTALLVLILVFVPNPITMM